MQQYLITTDEVSALSRGMSVHLDPDKIETYIRESENIYIKSALGDELFLDVKKNPEKYQLLLDGGTYETKCKKKIIITGTSRSFGLLYLCLYCQKWRWKCIPFRLREQGR